MASTSNFAVGTSNNVSIVVCTSFVRKYCQKMLLVIKVMLVRSMLFPLMEILENLRANFGKNNKWRYLQDETSIGRNSKMLEHVLRVTDEVKNEMMKAVTKLEENAIKTASIQEKEEPIEV